MTKIKNNSVLWMAFSDEIEKLAGLAKPTTLGDMRKAVSYEGTALMKRKPTYAKVNKDITPASPSDLTEGAKNIQPPPVTMPRGSF